MVSTYDQYLRRVVVRGEREARDDGSATVEAHHLLLAVAEDPEVSTREVLASVGLDRRAVRAALDREFEHSLNAAGVSLRSFALPRPSGDVGRPKLGASAKLALERGVAAAGRKKDLRPAHVLLGILQAEVGTVPRALALADIDRIDLRVRVMGTLTPGAE
ncbi:Clp protease N-terminal domain-containing protein [Streptoalloteichus hindustanus]|uniref:Clp amino terminal domain-containing protein, pathogenicity island component n=1 Tax=Streptoalloteichus hindustanus TaxID=2017 RepID=A0A1M5MUN7_STRHI|nr:Clp protease N-terminal domain-containing protein [Streptoalloteichus hindustanus]SHG81080.1 Clp amino terminal domain-containing protein, pathogenicity island component [Streptoalloteichus hindustanus]